MPVAVAAVVAGDGPPLVDHRQPGVLAVDVDVTERTPVGIAVIAGSRVSTTSCPRTMALRGGGGLGRAGLALFWGVDADDPYPLAGGEMDCVAIGDGVDREQRGALVGAGVAERRRGRSGRRGRALGAGGRRGGRGRGPAS